MTDAMEAVGQDVEEKAADELVRAQAHDAAASAAAIVLVGERDLLVIDGHEPGIGDGGAVRVAGEIGEHALGSAEGRLGVDDEGALAQGAHRARRRRRGRPAGSSSPKKPSSPRRKAACEAVEEQPAERLRQGANGEQEVRLAGDPPPAVEGDAAAGNEAMDMRVMGQRLPPSVQHRDQGRSWRRGARRRAS